MATQFDYTNYYGDSDPVSERLRLWYKEHEPELDRKLAEMWRNNDAALGGDIREHLSRTPDDHQGVLKLVEMVEHKKEVQTRLLNEEFEAKAERFRTTLLRTPLKHHGELDQSAEVRERIKKDASLGTTYCSPILMETLLWEGLDQLPNAHRKQIELDFPDRVEALLDFHCIAFHADVGVLKALYDEDVLKDRERKEQILSMHQKKMEALMKMFADDMKSRWKEGTEHLRLRSQNGSMDSPQNDDNFRTPVDDAVRRLAREADPPTIFGPTTGSRKTTVQLPLRGILKNAPKAPVSFIDPDIIADKDEDDPPGSFFRNELIPASATEYLDEEVEEGLYTDPEIVLASRSRPRYTSASTSILDSHPAYEIFYPVRGVDDIGPLTAMPRSASNVAWLTQKFEGMEGDGNAKGKGNAKVRL